MDIGDQYFWTGMMITMAYTGEAKDMYFFFLFTLLVKSLFS